jgi:hypothetical protein
MSEAEISGALQDLLARHTPTMDHVAILLDLRNVPGEAHAVPDIAARTRVDPAVAERVLRDLTTSQIVSREGDTYRYAPAAGLRDTVEYLAEMYRTRPVTLVRAIYDRPTRAAQSFADAFRLRKGEG